jgi:hypothetical protein
MCLNEIYRKIRVVKYLYDAFPTRNCLKQGDALWLLLLNFSSQYAFMKVQENKQSLEFDGTHQLLICSDDNLLGENTFFINKTQKL